MRVKAISIALALVVVAAAGCGGKKSASTAGGSGDATAASSAASSSSSSSSSNSGNSMNSASSFASAKNCARLASVGQKLAQAMAATSGTGKSSVTDVASAFTALADAAPSEIRGDFQTLATAFAAYAAGLKKAGYTPGKAPTPAQIAALTSLSKTFSAPKLQAAERHLSAWARKNCGTSTG